MLQSLRRRFLSTEPDDATPGDIAPTVLAERLGTLRDGARRDGVRPAPRDAAGPDPAAQGPAEFVGYALDCEIQALAAVDDIESVRWSDLLNSASEIELREAVLTGLSDGVAHNVGDLTIARDELVAVWASAFRGTGERRVRTRGERVTFTSGPYRIVGYLHAMPTTDAFATFERRDSMVPLTEARILIPQPAGAPGARCIVSGGTLIVNRALMGKLELWHEATEYPAVAARFAQRMPLKDMTGGSLVA